MLVFAPFSPRGQLGLLLNRFFSGQAPPSSSRSGPQWPQARTLGMKLTSRLRAFFVEAVPFVLIGLFIVAVFYRTGLSDVIGKLAAPVVSNLWGLPPDSATVFIAGLLRKDLAVGMMEGFDLAAGQMATAAVVLTLYFPCLATFSVLLSELGFREMLKASAIMLATSSSAARPFDRLITACRAIQSMRCRFGSRCSSAAGRSPDRLAPRRHQAKRRPLA